MFLISFRYLSASYTGATITTSTYICKNKQINSAILDKMKSYGTILVDFKDSI